MNGFEEGIDAGSKQPGAFAVHHLPASEIHDGTQLSTLGQQSQLTEPKPSGIENPFRFLRLDLLKHSFFEARHRGLCHEPPDIVAEIKNLKAMGIGLCDIKIASNQGYQKGIKNIIKKFVK